MKNACWAISSFAQDPKKRDFMLSFHENIDIFACKRPKHQRAQSFVKNIREILLTNYRNALKFPCLEFAYSFLFLN